MFQKNRGKLYFTDSSLTFLPRSLHTNFYVRFPRIEPRKIYTPTLRLSRNARVIQLNLVHKKEKKQKEKYTQMVYAKIRKKGPAQRNVLDLPVAPERDALMSTVVNGSRAHLNAHFLRNPAKSLRPSKAFQLRGMRLASGISATRRYIFFSFSLSFVSPFSHSPTFRSPSTFVFAASGCG